MLKSDGMESKLRLWTRQAGIAVLCALTPFLIRAPSAIAQGTTEFTLQPGALDPAAIAPGGSSASNITVGSVNGFAGSVTLGCQITANQTTNAQHNPVCTVSPTSVKPPASATATITTDPQTTTVAYGVTITGAGPTTSYSAPPLNLTVLAVTPQFTITVETGVQPSSVPAGNGAEGIISVNPSNGYVGSVTLYCSSITPLVVIPPVCSFSYPKGATSLPVNGVPATSTLTINTFGPVPVTAASHPRPFYALWLPLPLLGLVGLGAAVGGKKSRKALGLLALFIVSGSLLLLPACATNTGNLRTTTPNGITPANTYTFTIVGVDGNGVVSSNTGSGSAAPTATLTVTAPSPTQ
jgi:hypothetical protein